MYSNPGKYKADWWDDEIYPWHTIGKGGLHNEQSGKTPAMRLMVEKCCQAHGIDFEDESLYGSQYGLVESR